MKLAPFVAMLLGFIGAYQFYIRSPETPKALGGTAQRACTVPAHKWYFDELYDFLFVRRRCVTGGSCGSRVMAG